MTACHEKRSDIKVRYFALLRQLLVYIAIAAAVWLSVFIWHTWFKSRASAELALNYEQAPKGLAPDETHFAVSFIKSDAVLAPALEAIGLPELTTQQLAERITISPARKTDGTQSATLYTVTYKSDISLFGPASPSAEAILRAVMQAGQTSFSERYFTSALPQPDWDECSALEYIEVGSFIQKECARLERFLQAEQAKSTGSVQAAQTISSLLLRLKSLEHVDLENYNALVLQSGSAKSSEHMQAAIDQWNLAHALASASAQTDQSLPAPQQAPTSAEAEKADLAIAVMQQRLTELYAEAAAVGAELAGQRAQQALSVTYKTTFVSTMPRGLFAAAVGCTVFCALCAIGLLSRRRLKACKRENVQRAKQPRRGYAVVVLAAAFAGVIFYQRTNVQQVYTAQAVIKCNAAPDAEALFSEANVHLAQQSFCLSASTEAIRSGGSVSESSQNTYTVSLALDDDSSIEEVRFALDSLLSCYCSRGGEAGVVPASASHIYEPEHDYLDQAELLSSFISDILPPLESYADTHPEFVSAETGYSLDDLANEYRTLRDGRLAYVLADILQNRLTKDSTLLMQKYQQRCGPQSGRTAEQISLDSQIFALYSQAEQPQNEQSAERAESELDAIQAQLQTLHPTLLSTLNEYYKYCGAQGNAMLTPVTASPKINIWLYTLLGAGGVLIGGCVLLSVHSRLQTHKHEVT